MKNINPGLILFPTMMILSDSIRTADKLSGKFFGSSFPLLANFYANDFLIWGIFLFSAIGVIVGNIDLKYIKNKKWEYLILFGALTIPVFVIANFNLRMIGNDDFKIIGGLFEDWIRAYWYSGMLFPLSKLFGISLDNKSMSKSGT